VASSSARSWDVAATLTDGDERTKDAVADGVQLGSPKESSLPL
jgi:hypothetical protein